MIDVSSQYAAAKSAFRQRLRQNDSSDARRRSDERGISNFSGEVVVPIMSRRSPGLRPTEVDRRGPISTERSGIRPWQGTERRFTFTNTDVPARKGHRVTLLLGGGRPLALINFSTEQYVNLVTPRQFESSAPSRRSDSHLVNRAGLAGSGGLVALLVGSAAYGSIKWLVRQQRYREAWSSVEAEIRPHDRASSRQSRRGSCGEALPDNSRSAPRGTLSFRGRWMGRWTSLNGGSFSV